MVDDSDKIENLRQIVHKSKLMLQNCINYIDVAIQDTDTTCNEVAQKQRLTDVDANQANTLAELRAVKAELEKLKKETRIYKDAIVALKNNFEKVI